MGIKPQFVGTCDWGNCNAPVVAWRFDHASWYWLCVCQEHFSQGARDKQPTLTFGELEALYRAQIAGQCLDERLANALHFIRITWDETDRGRLMDRLLTLLEDAYVVMEQHAVVSSPCPFTFAGACRDIQKQLREIGPLFGRHADYYDRQRNNDD